MYDPQQVLAAIDANPFPILVCLVIIAGFAFAYFGIALRMALAQQVYVVPLAGASLFFWHDLSFVLMHEQWFNVYDHWWLKLWWCALTAAVLLEAFLISQVIRYGHRELAPDWTRAQFAVAVIALTLAVGALWSLVKATLDDPLFLVTFAITAVWSLPFHTAIMFRRRSRAGQSVFMEGATIVMVLAMTYAFAQLDAFFRSPIYLTFVACFVLWALFNMALIRRLPERAPTRPVQGATL